MELAGAEVPKEVKPQVEGRSLVPLLQDPKAHWDDRFLFTHVGRWERFSDPSESKFRSASVRNTRWAMVSDSKGSAPNWQLFDLSVDYGQTTDVLAAHPEVAKELASAFDTWWGECLPLMVNEKAVGPAVNPFQALYYKQFGGSPTAAALEAMDPLRPLGGQRAKKPASERKPDPAK
jgi:arylsulfatase